MDPQYETALRNTILNNHPCSTALRMHSKTLSNIQMDVKQFIV